MVGKVELVNTALVALGSPKITSFNDNTSSAQLINQIYDVLVDEVLAEHDWTCATFRATLAASTTAPTYDFTYRYPLPTNPFCLKVIEADNGYGTDFPYRIESGAVVTDASTLKIKYVGRLTDSGDYNIYFQTALLYKIKASIARKVTGSTSEAKFWEEMYQMKLNLLISQDSQQGSSDMITSTSYTDEVR